MSVSAAIRRMLDAGLTIDQALIAAEAMEAEFVRPKSAGAIRQQRYRRLLDVSADEWGATREMIFERDGFQCVYCGADVRLDPQCDHIFPLALGGRSEPSNLATSCKACNSSKRDRTIYEWQGRRH